MSDPSKPRKRVEVPTGIGPHGIQCPKCHCRHMKAYRSTRVGDRMVRRRQCRHCGHCITTAERIVSNG